jgi:hypothetical protein
MFEMSSASNSEFNQFFQDMLSQPTPNRAMGSNFAATSTQALSMVAQATPESVHFVGDHWSMYSESTPPSHHSDSAISSTQPYKFIDFFAVPNFDPSTLNPQPFPPPADIIARSEAAAKQAKLDQWCAHLAAAAELEREFTTTSAKYYYTLLVN